MVNDKPLLFTPDTIWIANEKLSVIYIQKNNDWKSIRNS